MSVKSMNSTVTLSDGKEMPIYGLGTSKSRENDAYEATIFALQNGYDLIDTAQRYDNEAQIGRGIKECGRSRQDIFLVTKQWESGKDRCLADFVASMQRLKTNYVDLFLIHSPLGVGEIVETYDAILQLQNSGQVRSVGVSNFNIHHLEGLRKANRPTPAVNQIELHPFQRKSKLVEYCRLNNITVMGYSPLAKAGAMTYRPLVDMAKKYGKTVAQVMIRWSVQKGYITIPKSKNKQRIIENTKVFDWEIDDDDMQAIEDFPEMKVAWETEDTPWDG